MKRSSLPFTMKQFKTMYKKGTLSFDYPIQRKGGQWDSFQKSLLIHSMSEGYPIPSIYSLIEKETIINDKGKEKEESIYKILDGKQRLTNIISFLDNEYKLHEETPNVTLDDEMYELGGKSFEELDEEIQDEILSYNLSVIRIEEATDEEIEDMFYRLNNGTPLSSQQKAKAKMGTVWANKMQELVSHELIKEKVPFTELQLRRADDEMVLLQSMLLIDSEADLVSLSSNHIAEYSSTFRGQEKEEIVTKIQNAMNYLNEAFEVKEKLLFKKIHFPVMMLAALKGLEMGFSASEFYEWALEFKDEVKNKESDYRQYCGQGSIKKDKVQGRIEEMSKHFDGFFVARVSKEEVKQLETPVEATETTEAAEVEDDELLLVNE